MTPPHLTPERVAEIKDREKKATNAPWTVHEKSADTDLSIYGTFVDGPPYFDNEGNMRIEDAEFSAHARTDIPDLLTHIEALEKELESLPCKSCRGLGGSIDFEPMDEVTWFRPCISCDMRKTALAAFRRKMGENK